MHFFFTLYEKNFSNFAPQSAINCFRGYRMFLCCDLSQKTNWETFPLALKSATINLLFCLPSIAYSPKKARNLKQTGKLFRMLFIELLMVQVIELQNF